MLNSKDLSNLLTNFVDYLIATSASRATVKNYSSDLGKVFAKVISDGLITSADLYSSLDELKGSFSEATIRRFGYSLKSFVSWAKSQGYNLEVINHTPTPAQVKISPVENYIAQLNDQGAPKTTVENYTKDLSRFLFWVKPSAKSLTEVDSKTVGRVSALDIKRYINYLKSKSFSQASINRYLFSLKDFFKYNKKEVVFDNNPVRPSFLNQNISNQSRWKRLIKYRPYWWHAYRSHPISDYLNWAALAVVTLFVGLGLYQNLFPQKVVQLAQNNNGIVLGSAAPPRILSFQGRLTNASGTPIVVATNVVFNIYTVRTGGSTSWTSKTWSVAPDANGIFSVCLGGQDTTDDCLLNGVADTVIPANLFTDNPSLYLGITVGGDPEATPRQRIASSTYALNAGAVNSSFSSATDNDFGNSISVTNAAGSGTVTVNGINITGVGTSTANTNNINAVNFPSVAPIANNYFYGLNFGTGYTDILRYNNTQLISGTGRFQNSGFDNTLTYTNLVKTGTLTAGATGAGFTIDLANSTISGTLGITNGGTNSNAAIGGAGAVIYSDGTKYAYGGTTGSSGLCLLSGTSGTGQPTWTTCPGGSTRLDQILAATSTPTTIDSTTFNQTWNWSGLIAQTAFTLDSTATGLTTGGILALGSTTTAYNHEAANTGSVGSLTFKDATSGAFASTTNGLLVSPTINITAGAATKTINGISVNPTFTACTTATCSVNGLNIAAVTDSGNFNSAVINVGSGWDALISTTAAQTYSSTQTSGTILYVNPASSVTLSTPTMTGLFVDLSNNYTTFTNGSYNGIHITTPDGYSNSLTKLNYGLNIDTGTGTNITSTGNTTTYAGVNVTLPSITQTSGSITSNGINLIIPNSSSCPTPSTCAIITDGTINGINVPLVATGPSAGTINGVNIGGFTTTTLGGTVNGIKIGNVQTSGGTDTAVNIGTGWDNSISASGFTVSGTGHAAIGSGSAISTSKVLDVKETITDDAGSPIGGLFQLTNNTTIWSGFDGAGAIGVNGRAIFDASNANSFLTGIIGGLFEAQYHNTGVGTHTSIEGVRVQNSSLSGNAGTIASSYGFRVLTPTWTAGAPTNTFGLDIANQGNASTTAAYGINISGQTAGTTSTALNIENSAGSATTKTAINIGTGWDYGITLPLAGTAALILSDTSFAAAGGILFGADTTLYRSAANTLKTDDNFIVNLDLTVTGNDIIFGNGETISNATNGIFNFTNGSNTIFSFNTSTGAGLFGLNESINGSITLYSSGVGITDPTIATDATGSLILTAAPGNLTVGTAGTATNLVFLESSFISASTGKSINLGDGTNTVTFNLDRSNTTYNFSTLTATSGTIYLAPNKNLQINTNGSSGAIKFGTTPDISVFNYSNGEKTLEINSTGISLYSSTSLILGANGNIYNTIEQSSSGLSIFLSASKNSNTERWRVGSSDGSLLGLQNSLNSSGYQKGSYLNLTQTLGSSTASSIIINDASTKLTKVFYCTGASCPNAAPSGTFSDVTTPANDSKRDVFFTLAQANTDAFYFTAGGTDITEVVYDVKSTWGFSDPGVFTEVLEYASAGGGGACSGWTDPGYSSSYGFYSAGFGEYESWPAVTAQNCSVNGVFGKWYRFRFPNHTFNGGATPTLLYSFSRSLKQGNILDLSVDNASIFKLDYTGALKNNLTIGSQLDTNTGGLGASCGCQTNSAVGTFGADTNRDAVNSSVVYKGKLFVSVKETDLGAVYRYDPGTNPNSWTLVTNTPGKAVSGDTNTTIDSYVLSVFNGALYIGSQGSTDTGALYSSTTADTTANSFTLVNATRGSFGMSQTTINGVADLTVWRNNLYVLTQEANVAELGRWDSGTTFTQINATDGKGAAEATADIDGGVLKVFQDRLYWGTQTGSTTARMYTWNGTGTAVNLTLMNTAGTFGADGTEVDVTSMAVWNGDLYAAVSKTNAAGVYRYNPVSYSVDATSTNWQLVSSAVGKIAGADTANIDSVILQIYNGRLYAGSANATDGTGALYEYDGVPGSWTLINTTRGNFNNNTLTDAVSTLQDFNGTLYIGVDDGTANKGAVYSWSKTVQNSYSLRFDSGNVYNQNFGSISFVGDRQAQSNDGHYGTFVFSNTVALSAGAFDYAEDFPTFDTSLEAGQIVSIDLTSKEHVKKATRSDKTTSFVGIVSTNPGFSLSSSAPLEGGDRYVPIALVGRVPLKVSSENGPIEPGDLLTLSSMPGVGAKAQNGSPIIGKALEGYENTDPSAIGKISVLVQNYIPYSGSLENDPIWSGKISFDKEQNIVATVSASARFVWKNTAGKIVAWVSDSGEALFAKVTALIGDFGKLVFGEAVVRKDAQTAGQASFAANDTGVVVPSDKVRDDSLINLTPFSKTGGVHLYIKEIKAGESFTVGLERDSGDQPNQATASATAALNFNWFILNQQ